MEETSVESSTKHVWKVFARKLPRKLPWKLPQLPWKHGSDENFRGSRGSFHELPPKMKIVQVAPVERHCITHPPRMILHSKDDLTKNNVKYYQVAQEVQKQNKVQPISTPTYSIIKRCYTRWIRCRGNAGGALPGSNGNDDVPSHLPSNLLLLPVLPLLLLL